MKNIKTLPLLFVLLIAFAACKKDKDGQKTVAQADEKIVGTWKNTGSTFEPYVGQVIHRRTFVLNNDFTYTFEEKSSSSTGGYTGGYSESGSFALSEVEEGKVKFFEEKLKETVGSLDRKINQATVNNDKIEGYIQYLEDGSFRYYWYDGENAHWRRYSK